MPIKGHHWAVALEADGFQSSHYATQSGTTWNLSLSPVQAVFIRIRSRHMFDVFATSYEKRSNRIHRNLIRIHHAKHAVSGCVCSHGPPDTVLLWHFTRTFSSQGMFWGQWHSEILDISISCFIDFHLFSLLILWCGGVLGGHWTLVYVDLKILFDLLYVFEFSQFL